MRNAPDSAAPMRSVEEVKAMLDTTEKGGVRNSIRNCLTVFQYLTLSGDEWEHERPRERQTEKKPSIKERLEQSRKECANQSKAQPHREKPAPER